MEEIRLFLDYVIVPLICWIFYIDRKVVRLEAEKTTNKDLEMIYDELKELHKKIDNGFVSYKTCEAKHS